MRSSLRPPRPTARPRSRSRSCNRWPNWALRIDPPRGVRGFGRRHTHLRLALEELGRADQSVGGHGVGVGSLGGGMIARLGTDEQKERWLPDSPQEIARVVRADRAGRWLRRRRRSHHGETRGRPVGARGLEGVHHQQRHGDHRLHVVAAVTDPGRDHGPRLSWSRPAPRVSPWVRPTARWDGTRRHARARVRGCRVPEDSPAR